MNPHPNATVALVAGTGGGTLVAWILDDVAHLGVPAAGCAAVAGAVAAVALFIGRKGVRGLIAYVWKGSDADPVKRVAE